jgi:hypothetical protein
MSPTQEDDLVYVGRYHFRLILRIVKFPPAPLCKGGIGGCPTTLEAKGGVRWWSEPPRGLVVNPINLEVSD